jgi:uncharacterized protein (TIGR02118 family)
MTKVTILYPNTQGSRFDMRYYLETHMPLSISLLNTHAGFRSCWVERGLGSDKPGVGPAYVTLCHFLFESFEAFWEAFMPHAGTLQGDLPNYTDITPVIQISEVLISHEGRGKVDFVPSRNSAQSQSE